MKKFLSVAALVISAGALRAAPRRVAGTAKATTMPPYPAEARKLRIEGNVVMTGEVTPEGAVSGLTVIGSSSPILDSTALRTVGKWKFSPATFNGKPVAVVLNAVVRFRKDRGRPGIGLAPGTLPAPMVGNLVVSPGASSAQGTAPEGFAVIRGDKGVRGVLDLDVPATPSPHDYRVAVTDVSSRGRSLKIVESTLRAGGPQGRSFLTLPFFRPVNAADIAEQGLHTLHVTVDGKDAGGARYRVEAGPPSPGKRARSR